jgi:hypothetical protein
LVPMKSRPAMGAPSTWHPLSNKPYPACNSELH